MSTSIKRIITAFGCGLLLAGSVGAGVVAPKAAIDGFLGADANAGAILTFVKESDGAIYFVDLKAATFTEKLLCDDVANIESPLISPDGRMVTFGTTTGKYYVCALAEDATAYEIGSGFDPHWWIHGDSTFIVYCTNSGKMSWPMPGKTYRQRIVWDGAAPSTSGSPIVVADYSFTGGLSKNGNYICTAYDDVVMYNKVSSTQYILNKGVQACNPSITPTTSNTLFKDAEMMMLSLGGDVGGTVYQMHEIFYILNRFDQVIWSVVNPPGTVEWQKPEWSTNENFAVATAQHTNDYHVYIVRTMEDDDYLEVIDGNNTYPHLWVAASASVGDSRQDAIRSLGMTMNALPVRGASLTVGFAAAVNGKLDLFTADGRMVGSITVNGSTASMPVDGLAAGVYILQGTVDGQQVARNVIISD